MVRRPAAPGKSGRCCCWVRFQCVNSLTLSAPLKLGFLALLNCTYRSLFYYTSKDWLAKHQEVGCPGAWSWGVGPVVCGQFRCETCTQGYTCCWWTCLRPMWLLTPPSQFGHSVSLSLAVMGHEAYTTGFQWESTFWRRIAPNPYEDASADTFVGTSGQGGTVSAQWVLWALSSLVQRIFLLRAPEPGMCSTQQLLEWLGEAGQVWCELPQLINHAQESAYSSSGMLRDFNSRTADIFSGSRWMPLWSMMWPSKWMLGRWNTLHSMWLLPQSDMTGLHSVGHRVQLGWLQRSAHHLCGKEDWQYLAHLTLVQFRGTGDPKEQLNEAEASKGSDKCSQESGVLS